MYLFNRNEITFFGELFNNCPLPFTIILCILDENGTEMDREKWKKQINNNTQLHIILKIYCLSQWVVLYSIN